MTNPTFFFLFPAAAKYFFRRRAVGLIHRNKFSVRKYRPVIENARQRFRRERFRFPDFVESSCFFVGLSIDNACRDAVK